MLQRGGKKSVQIFTDKRYLLHYVLNYHCYPAQSSPIQCHNYFLVCCTPNMANYTAVEKSFNLKVKGVE